MSPVAHVRQVEIGIITIKEEENEAVLKRFPAQELLSSPETKRLYALGVLRQSDGRMVKYAVIRCEGQGNTTSLEATRDMLVDVAPQVILVVGIAGAAPGKDVTLGDVAVSASVVDMSLEEVRVDGSRRFDAQTQSSTKAAAQVVSNLVAFRTRLGDWNSEANLGSKPQAPEAATEVAVDSAFAGDVRKSLAMLSPPRPPAAKNVKMVASDRLIKNPELVALWQNSLRSVTAFEMESAGVYKAANERAHVYSIRGISDIVGLPRNEQWTRYACSVAAEFAHAFVWSGVVSLAGSTVDSSSAPPTGGGTPVARALRNVVAFGDTDVFAFPLEQEVFKSDMDLAMRVVARLDREFDEVIKRSPPANESSLVPAGYSGFRWATQIDPVWNVYFLSCVMQLGAEIETSRLSPSRSIVFSYRYSENEADHLLFRRDVGWPEFIEACIARAKKRNFVLRCDVADFYHQISHQRLREALARACKNIALVDRVMSLLKAFSPSGFGLPVGGPAARLLAEVYLNRADHLLSERHEFCRFADDYVFFVDSEEQAHSLHLEFSQMLMRDEGLSLQKLKTRVQRSADYARSVSELVRPEQVEGSVQEEGANEARQFLSIRLRYDPYSESADTDYAELQKQVAQFDVVGMLSRELAKSRIHDALTRRLIKVLGYLDPPVREQAVLSLYGNLRVLAPVLTSVLQATRSLFPGLSQSARDTILGKLYEGLDSGHYLFQPAVVASYAVRLLAIQQSDSVASLLSRLFDSRKDSILRRDIILLNVDWRRNNWISSLKGEFQRLPSWERRALVLGSFILGEEGVAWRRTHEAVFDHVEQLFVEWAETFSGNLPVLLK